MPVIVAPAAPVQMEESGAVANGVRLLRDQLVRQVVVEIGDRRTH